MVIPTQTNGKSPDHTDGVGAQESLLGYSLTTLPDVITVDFRSGEIPHREGILTSLALYAAVAERTGDPRAAKKRNAAQYMADLSAKMYVSATPNETFVYGQPLLGVVSCQYVAVEFESLYSNDLKTLIADGVVEVDGSKSPEDVARELDSRYSFFRDSAVLFQTIQTLPMNQTSIPGQDRAVTRKVHETYFSLLVLEQHAALAQHSSDEPLESVRIIREKIKTVEQIMGIDRLAAHLLSTEAQAQLSRDIDGGRGSNRKIYEAVHSAVVGGAISITKPFGEHWIDVYGRMTEEIDTTIAAKLDKGSTALTVIEQQPQVETIDIFPTDKQIAKEFLDDAADALKMAQYFRSLVVSRLAREQRIAKGILERDQRDPDVQNSLFVGPSGSGKTNGIFHDIATRFGIEVYVDDFTDWTPAGFRGKHKGNYVFDLISRVKQAHPEMTYEETAAHIESGKVLWMFDEVHRLFEGSESGGCRTDFKADPEAIQTELLAIAGAGNNLIRPTPPDSLTQQPETQEITRLQLNTRNLPVVLAFDPKPALLSRIRGRAMSELGIRNAPIDPYVALEVIDGVTAGKIFGLRDNLANRFQKTLINRPPTYDKFIDNLYSPVEKNPRSQGFALRNSLAIACGMVNAQGIAQPDRILFVDGVIESIAHAAFDNGADWRSLQAVVRKLVDELGSFVQQDRAAYEYGENLFFSDVIVDTILAS